MIALLRKILPARLVLRVVTWMVARRKPVVMKVLASPDTPSVQQVQLVQLYLRFDREFGNNMIFFRWVKRNQATINQYQREGKIP